MATLAEYEAGALSAWTPAQQAALNAERYQKQLNQDLIESKRDEEREARAKVDANLQKAREQGDEKAKARYKRELERLDKRYGPAPELKRRGDRMIPVWEWADEATEVGNLKKMEKESKKKREEGYGKALSLSAGQIVDNAILSWNPPIYASLDVFGPPHIVIIPFIAAHMLYWMKAPWYLRFLTPYPVTYMIPILSALKSLKDKKTRILWMAYFFQLAVLEYGELLFYRDRTRSAVMWPKIKALACLVGYTIVEPSDDDPIYGAIKLMTILLRPSAPTAEELEDEQEEKEWQKAKEKEAREKKEAARKAARAKADAGAEAGAGATDKKSK